MQTIEPLTPRRRVALKEFMNRPGHPEGTLTYWEMQGFLFAVACVPEIVMPSQWLPRIFGGNDPPFNTPKEATAVTGGLMALFNELAPSDGADPRLPEDCAFRKDPLANLEPDAPVAQWGRGFRLGHLWLEGVWEASLPEELEEHFTNTVATLSFFAAGKAAETIARELEGSGRTLESLTTDFRDLFPKALASYSYIGHSLFKASLKAATEARGPAVATPGPGRNDPCPCGSGRKYKRCCGRQAH